jgi:RNA polymerase-binding transcription factor DksA
MKTIPVADHRHRLEALRAETQERLRALRIDDATLDEIGTDVGAGDDEGGSEADTSLVERDRVRALISEDEEQLVAIEQALARSRARGWDLCTECGGPIGEARLEAIPTTSVCVTCKAGSLRH